MAARAATAASTARGRHAAALTAVLAALVYAYELIGSVKEITALAMLLASGCLVAGLALVARRAER